ncbi:serine protease inhibitor [Streptacidiphilus sp. MAP12-16]|uniref:serpin family protein n=1 Tax=Streptacidiphilus sp. MAP12-16 TaxID=3156300 RepID=UPI003517B78A
MTNTATVRSVNALTASWASVLPDRGTVFAAAGVWPLLALLAGSAGGAARTELAQALNAPAEGAGAQARHLLATTSAMRGVKAALGLWTRETLPVEPAWLDTLPAHVHEQLTGDPVQDQERLDAWAKECTSGQIDSMPVTLDKVTLLVLASALIVRTDWIRPFASGGMEAEAGPWQGLPLAGLSRATRLLDRVGVAQTPAGPLTVLRVLGSHGVDIHLFLGAEPATPSQVLTAGVHTLDHPRTVTPGNQLPYGAPGPGLSVERVPSMDGEPRLHVQTVPFTLAAHHDLLDSPDLFGLRTATDSSQGHFPGISRTPLAIQSAAQTMTATFTARGFRSSAVTAISGIGGGMPRYPYQAREITARFDRPFGFLAVHRTSRLVLNAGWVTEPDLLEEPTWEQ